MELPMNDFTDYVKYVYGKSVDVTEKMREAWTALADLYSDMNHIYFAATGKVDLDMYEKWLQLERSL